MKYGNRVAKYVVKRDCMRKKEYRYWWYEEQKDWTRNDWQVKTEWKSIPYAEFFQSKRDLTYSGSGLGSYRHASLEENKQ
jgi:hypothetical protein